MPSRFFVSTMVLLTITAPSARASARSAPGAASSYWMSTSTDPLLSASAGNSTVEPAIGLVLSLTLITAAVPAVAVCADVVPVAPLSGVGPEGLSEQAAVTAQAETMSSRPSSQANRFEVTCSPPENGSGHRVRAAPGTLPGHALGQTRAGPSRQNAGEV